MEKIHAIKIAYLTDKLHLTSQQAERFWPIYNSYEQEMMEMRKSFMDKNRDKKENKDEASSREFIDAHLDLQEKQLELKRKYKDQLLKVISAQQLADLYKSEMEFNQMLLQRLKERRGGGNRQGPRNNGGDDMYR